MAWVLVTSWTYSTPVAQVDFTGLAAYSDVRVLIRNVTLSGAGVRSLRVSTDNGSTFLSSTADYLGVAGDGTESGGAGIGLHITASASARSGELEICGFNLTSPKVAQRLSRTDARCVVLPSASAFNAVRIYDSSAFNLSGGNIYLFAR
jgi:hypothetical protein